MKALLTEAVFNSPGLLGLRHHRVASGVFLDQQPTYNYNTLVTLVNMDLEYNTSPHDVGCIPVQRRLTAIFSLQRLNFVTSPN